MRKQRVRNPASGGVAASLFVVVALGAAAGYLLPIGELVVVGGATIGVWIGELLAPLELLLRPLGFVAWLDPEPPHVTGAEAAAVRTLQAYLGACIPLFIALVWLRRRKAWLQGMVRSQVAVFEAIYRPTRAEESAVQSAARDYLSTRLDGGALPEGRVALGRTPRQPPGTLRPLTDDGDAPGVVVCNASRVRVTEAPSRASTRSVWRSRNRRAL